MGLREHTLSASAIELSSLPAELTKKLPSDPEVPAIMIGRLARNIAFPSVGTLLQADALKRCVRVAQEIAASIIVVDSKGAAATHIYKKLGLSVRPAHKEAPKC